MGDVADTVVTMESYTPRDVTLEAKQVVEKMTVLNAPPPTDETFPPIKERRLLGGLSCSGKCGARSLRCISYGDEEIELTFVEQLVEISQAKALCDMLQFIDKDKQLLESGRFSELCSKVASLLDQETGSGSGLDRLSYSGKPNGFYSKPRRLEIAACINRLRTAKFC